jgi:hypothetical protein
MQIKVTTQRGAFAGIFKGVEGTIAKAAKAAVEQTAATVKTQARANIIGAGLGPRLASALRVDAYPRRGIASIDAAAVVRSKADYMGIFETGGTIMGNPLLWLPLASTPKRIGRKKMTAGLYAKQIGPLYPIERPGKAPLLAGSIASNRRGQGKAGAGKVTLSALRRGNAGKSAHLVPLFVGVPAATIGRKTDIRGIAEAAAGRLPALVIAKLRTR